MPQSAPDTPVERLPRDRALILGLLHRLEAAVGSGRLGCVAPVRIPLQLEPYQRLEAGDV